MISQRGRKSITRNSTKYNGFNASQSSSPYNNNNKSSNNKLQWLPCCGSCLRTRDILLIVIVIISCFVVPPFRTREKELRYGIAQAEKMNRDREKIDDDALNAAALLNERRRYFIRRIPDYKGPRIIYGNDFDQTLPDACPGRDDSTSTRAAKFTSQTTLIVVFPFNAELSINLLSLCTKQWKTDPIVAIVTLQSGETLSSAALYVSNSQVASRCPHVSVLLYGGYLDNEAYELEPINVGKRNAFRDARDVLIIKNDGFNPNNLQRQSTRIYRHDSSQTKSTAAETVKRGNLTENTTRMRRVKDPQLPPSPPLLPLGYLHNVALQTVRTSHVLILDEDVQPMIDLDDSLRNAYTSVPSKAALLIPAVVSKDTDISVLDLSNCLQSKDCVFEERELEDWDNVFVKQLSCIKSAKFEPHLVVPWCPTSSPTEEELYLRQHGYSSERLPWHDETLTKATWRLGQADFLIHSGLSVWLAPGFVLPTKTKEDMNDQYVSTIDDENLWNSFHQRILEHFGDNLVQLPVCSAK